MADSQSLPEKKIVVQSRCSSSVIKGPPDEDKIVRDIKHESEDAIKLERVANETAMVQHNDDFPDGGLRAWLVVFGVSTFSQLLQTVADGQDPRRCVMHFLRLDM